MNMKVTFGESESKSNATLYSSNQSFKAGLSEGGGSGSGGAVYTAGANISIKNNVISVITTDETAQDNTHPITSAGVYAQIGNINALLETI